MGTVVHLARFQRKLGAGARSSRWREWIAANHSKVTPSTPRRSARETKGSQTSDGMLPRARQLLTAEGLAPSSRATKDVPPNALMSSSVVMDDKIFTKSEDVKPHNLGIAIHVLCMHDAAMAAHKRKITKQPEPVAYPETGARMKLFRKKFTGLSQIAIAEELDYPSSGWNMVETGKRPVPINLLRKLWERYRLPENWILRGEIDDLKVEQYRKMYGED